MLYAERHIGFFNRSFDIVKKPAQIGIRFIIEDHKTGININRFTAFVNRYGVGMDAHIIVLFVNSQVAVSMQKIGAAHTSYARSDDGGTPWPLKVGTNILCAHLRLLQAPFRGAGVGFVTVLINVSTA